jgi:hypothetical protein
MRYPFIGLALLIACCTQEAEPPAAPPAAAAPAEQQQLAEFHVIDRGVWFDATDIADINADGKPDVVSVDGNGGKVLWYEQGASKRDWTRHTIWDNADKSLAQVQAAAAGAFADDGQVDVLSGDQTNGSVILHRHSGDPAGPWRKATLVTARSWLQSVVTLDVDGDDRLDIVYAFEGDGAGKGGVHWLKFKGGDPLDPANWTDHVIAVHEGGWGLRVVRLLDMDGDGAANELIYSARHIVTRNAAARPGIYYATRPVDPTQPWPVTAVGNTPGDTVNFDVGDYFGRNDGRDVAVIDLRDAHAYLFDAGNNWAVTKVAFPEGIDGKPIEEGWNIQTIPGSTLGHNSLFAVMALGSFGHSAIYLLDHVDGAYRSRQVRVLQNAHAVDNRIVKVDLDGDGATEIVTSNSGGSELFWMEFKAGFHAPAQ